VVLANGAWRDRPLPVAGVEAFLGRGFLYQNSLVMAFNRGHEEALPPVVDDAIVIGGGLASIDVCKILSFRSYAAALAARGVTLDPEQFDKKGVAALCEAAGVDLRALGIRGPTLFYRRRAEDMPLVSADDGDSSRAAKLAQTRVRILEKAMEKYAFRFEPLASPVGVVAGADGALAGLRFQRNAMADGRLVAVPGEVFEARGPLVVASIGSIPSPIPGVPMDGELYRWRDTERGELAREADDGARLFGLGNVLTGKGNIVESRRNAKKVMDLVTRDALGLAAPPEAPEGVAAEAVARVVEAAVGVAVAAPEAVARVEAWVAARHAALGYSSYAAWLAAHPVAAEA
jgi:NADPH-dependent glutamate synthase beta subunit-like oxidoreductase